MFKILFKNRAFLSIFFAIIIFLFVFLLSIFFYWVNEKITNSLMWIKNIIDRKISDNIVVVTIDEKTFEKLGSFPFPRDYYKKFIENINIWKPYVIWFDIIFADKTKSNPEIDDIFSESIKQAWNIILWWAIIPKKIENKIVAIIEKPLDIFYDNALWFWYFQPEALTKTLTVLSFSPYKNISDKWFIISDYSHFSIALLKAYYSKIYGKDFMDYYEKDEHKFFIRPWYAIPFAKTGSNDVLINYIPIPKDDSWKVSNFKNFSFIDIYENNINHKEFENKIVIVWVTAKWIKDTFYTRNWIEYWVFVHANIINTILTKSFLLYFDENLEWLLVFLLIITSIYFSLSRSWYIIIFANLSIALLFLIIYPIFTIVFNNYILNHLFELFLALPFSIAIWNAIKYLSENNNKIKLSKALSEYVSKAIVKEILSNSWDIKLDWDVRKLCIFFSDIEWFTTISEKFSPQELVSFLRNYLSYMSNIILDNNWFINKYEWDAIMALWWAFSDSNKDSYNACLSAIEQQKLLKELNKNWKDLGFPEIRARIWLHSWQAIVWNIWAIWRKIEYTALGDNVNLASRLEWVNKFYWTFICASEDIYNENKDFFEFRYLDKIIVKWKQKPIKIYELLSLKWELDDEKNSILKLFNSAIDKYNSRDFLSARVMFENIYKKYNDWPSKTYIERCDYFAENPPSKDSELIWKFETK